MKSGCWKSRTIVAGCSSCLPSLVSFISVSTFHALSTVADNRTASSSSNGFPPCPKGSHLAVGRRAMGSGRCFSSFLAEAKSRICGCDPVEEQFSVVHLDKAARPRRSDLVTLFIVSMKIKSMCAARCNVQSRVQTSLLHCSIERCAKE